MSPTVVRHSVEDDKSDGEEVGLINTSNVLRLRSRRRCPEFTAVVMAAGYGSQMFELTNNLPKCMIPVANVPMIWYPVSFLVSNKFEEIYIVVRESARDKVENFLTTQLRKHNYDIHLDFVCIEDESDFGTADSLRLLAPKTKSDLLVTSCDLITTVSLSDLANVHRANNAALTALIAPRYTPPNAENRKRNKKDDRDFIGLDPADDRMLFISSEKDIEEEISLKRGQLTKFPHMRLHTNYLDSHLYLVSRAALNILTNHPCISMMRCELLPLLVRKQIKQIVNADAMFSDRIYMTHQQSEDDVNKPDGYFDVLREAECVGCYVHKTAEFTLRVNQLHNYIKYNRAVSDNMDDLIPKHDAATCDISKMTQVGKCSRLGDSVKIAEKCSIKRSFIGNGVQIGPHCKLTDCVVMGDVVIEDNVTLNNCVICADAVIRNKSTLKDCRICDGYEVAAESEFVNETLVKDDQNMMSFSICNSEHNSDADESSASSCQSK